MPPENGLAGAPQQLSAQIEDLVRRVEAISDPAVKANATVLIQSLLDLHNKAFSRIIATLGEEGEAGLRILNRLAADELIGSLLLLYDLHPESLEVRLTKAVQRAQNAVVSHGASVELIGVQEDAVRLRLSGSFQGCGSTKATLEKLVEDSIFECVPEVASVEIENAMQSGRSEPLVQLQLAPQRG